MKVKVLKNRAGKIIATFESQATSDMTSAVTSDTTLEPEVSKAQEVEEIEVPEDYVSRLDTVYQKKPARKKRDD